MQVTYKPEDAPNENQTWQFDAKRIRSDAAEQIEKHFGGSWDEFEMGVLKNETKARRVLLWHLMSLAHPTLKIKDVPPFYTGEVEVEQSSKELVAQYDRIFKLVPENEREKYQSVFDMQLAEAREREGLLPQSDTIDGELVDDEAKPGKDLKPSKSSATTTG
jgi:hypothetical protein